MEENFEELQHEEEISASPPKKVRLFSAKEFRQNLSTSEKFTALKEFLDLCSGSQSRKCIFDYLENGGSCLEIFQLLETSQEIPASITIKIVHYVLYEVVSNYARFHSPTYEACRYFLNTHLALVNKMLGLSSSKQERKVILKLLTVIVTFSSNLAKEILLHVNFNAANVEVLTKQTGENETVRNDFIHFLVAFLVEAEYPTISALLEKKWLLTSIIKGLKYDPAETVSMVVVALKNNILENTSISKTAKMSIFNTLVIKDIVNLYNWKGPSGIQKGKTTITVTVDEHEKSSVNEAVHSFLLVLCTSHKQGVIFRDHQLGLGKKTHNSLMYTVLESLDRPWEHSYAGELVTKICGACPDLVKTMWTNLKTFLELRATSRWLQAVKYAIVLVKEVGPEGIEFCARELGVFQLVQVIQMLVAPTPILKIIIPENHKFEKPSIKHNVLCMLVEFLKSVQRFLSAAKNWLKPQVLRIVKNSLQEHIARNFLDAQQILNDWTESDDELGPYSLFDHLEIIFELLDLYENLCPQLLESLSSVNLQNFLKEIQELPENANSLQIRGIKLFLSFEPSFFAAKTDLFGVILPRIVGFYFETKDTNAKTTLKLLLKNTWIFEGCSEEIDFWIDAVCDLSTYDDSIGQNLVGIVNQTAGNIFKYFSQMSKFMEHSEALVDKQNFQELLEHLNDEDYLQNTNFSVKHQTLSPLLLGTLEYLLGVEPNKHFKNYFSSVVINLVHFQTSPSLLAAIILNEKYKGLIPKYVVNYVNNWVIEGNLVVLSKTKSELSKNFSFAFLEGDVDEFFKTHQQEFENQPEQTKNFLNQALFYFCSLSKENLSETHVNNFKKVVGFLISKQKPQELVEKIFGHPFLLQSFSPLHLEKSKRTFFLIEVVKEFQITKEILGVHLDPFRAKLVLSAKRVFKKSKSGKKLLEIMEIFGLERQQCLEVLNFCSGVSIQELNQDCLNFYYNLVVFALKTLMNQLIELEPLNDDVVLAVIQLLTFLHKNQDKFDTSSCACVLKNYLEVFPHNVDTVTAELFENILGKTEFCKENSLLAGFLLSKRVDFLDLFVQSLPKIAGKKGLLLALLQAAILIEADDEVFRTAFRYFKTSIINALQKPQKAGQYFEMYQDVVADLVKKCMPRNVCRLHMEKVEKFEVTEPFHVHMLISMFNKSISDSKVKMVEDHLNNAILTLIHTLNLLFKKKSKSEDDDSVGKLEESVKLINNFLEKLIGNNLIAGISFRTVCKNESFQLCCKFCLKFGLPINVELIKLLKTIVQLVDFEENEARLLLDMAGSHSEFLEVVLNENSVSKVELLDLVLVLCERWPALMERNHVPVLLAAYRATVRPSDRIILRLLQMYEKAANKTNFYDFKPFLWGTAAATHYSVRQDVQKSLWRQPKMSNILEILQREWVHNTINNYPLDLAFIATKNISLEQNVYDLAFLLPLFSSLLAPENKASTYSFIRSGGLSLIIVAFSSNTKEIRLAACHVLARLHFHVEATQDKKGRFLWLRFIEAICRGTAVFEDCKLNNFAAIFWAKMALILTDPLQPLYMPLSHYLTAKEAPDLSGVPELYTFLHGSDVNYKHTRLFILEILRDGLRTDQDFTVAFRAAAFKLIMELFISCVVDLDTKILILTVFDRACKLKEGIKYLCSNCGLLSWLYEVVENLNPADESLFTTVIQILRTVTTNKSDLKLVDSNIIGLILKSVIDKGLICRLRKQELENLLLVLLNIFDEDSNLLNEERLRTIVTVNGSKKCAYLVKYGCKYSKPVSNGVEIEDLSQMIVTRWKKIK